jgi:hypothetical protein
VLQAELQQDIQRFSSKFTARVLDALAPLQSSPQPEVREAAMRQLLLYSASALDIATEPQPELGLLDMIVFVTLSRRIVDTYWVPKVFGEKGGGLVQAMAQSETEVWQLGDKILDRERREDLAALIRDWQQRNPDHQRVESIRFHTFSRVAGKLAEEQEKRASGLLSSLKTATAAADQAVLVAERALFLAHRVPFLLRMQARVGTHEIVGDTVAQLKSAGGVLDRVDAMVRRWLVYLLIIGAAWVMIFWGGYYVFKRLL